MTQVKPAPRAIIGFVFTSISIGILIVLAVKRGRSSQQLLPAWQNNPDQVVATITSETKPGQYVEHEEIGKIIGTLGKKYRLSQEQQVDLEVYLGNVYRDRQQQGKKLTPYEAVQACVNYMWNLYGKKQTTQNKERGKFWQH
jgi:hypothetical protein